MNKSDKTKILNKLKLCRIKKGVKTETLAKYLKISQGQFSKLENGKVSNWKEYIKPICEALEMDYSVFIKDFEKKNPNNTSVETSGLSLNLGKVNAQLENLMDEVAEINKKISKFIDNSDTNIGNTP
jgi:transcriptional regulator with XRE-family HTH domain